jgi:transcription elongation factor Elf1
MAGKKQVALRADSVSSKRPGMEYFFTCPYCWEEISMVLDPSVRSQIYVEDCEVCCHPIELRYAIEDGAVMEFEARVLE